MLLRVDKMPRVVLEDSYWVSNDVESELRFSTCRISMDFPCGLKRAQEIQEYN